MGDSLNVPAAAMALEALPHDFLVAVFSSLPPDERARCCVVHRSWNALLAHHDFWKILDVSPATVGMARPATEALLRGAAARAQGALVKLDVSGCDWWLLQALPDIAAASADTLLDVRVHVAAREYGFEPGLYGGFCRRDEIELLLAAAPNLRSLEADVHNLGVDDARHMLRGVPPFQPLRLRKVDVRGGRAEDQAAVWLALIQDLAAHAHVKDVRLSGAPLVTAPAVLDALVDAAVVRRWSGIALSAYGFTPACAPALSRLLRDGDALTTLTVTGSDRFPPVHMLDAHAAALLSAALRLNTTLTSLSLPWMHVWHDPGAAAELLGALTAHPSVRRLDLQHNSATHVCLQAAAAVEQLIAANAPALEALNMSYWRLGQDALGRVVGALPRNTHLRELNVWENGMGMWFMRYRLEPVLASNTSLRKLTITPELDDDIYDQESANDRRQMRAVEVMVARRAAGTEEAAAQM
jgi:hypothetical protein